MKQVIERRPTLHHTKLKYIFMCIFTDITKLDTEHNCFSNATVKLPMCTYKGTFRH